jgi:hypothetical protein
MLRPHHMLVLVSLLADGGTPPPPLAPFQPDAGPRVIQSHPVTPDAGSPVRQPAGTGGIQWPSDVRPLATLDGPAVVAAQAALQQLLDRFAKEGTAGSCAHSAKGLEVVVGEGGGMYIVRINQRMDKCGWSVPPGFSTDADWAELYAVSQDGRVLARYPFAP